MLLPHRVSDFLKCCGAASSHKLHAQNFALGLKQCYGGPQFLALTLKAHDGAGHRVFRRIVGRASLNGLPKAH